MSEYSLVSMYFFQNNVKEGHYTYGKILESLGQGFYLIYKTGCDSPYKCIYHTSQLLEGDDNICVLFYNEQELNEYIAWIEEPESNTKSNILTLVKDKT